MFSLRFRSVCVCVCVCLSYSGQFLKLWIAICQVSRIIYICIYTFLGKSVSQ
jgi:hypothetical protein